MSGANFILCLVGVRLKTLASRIAGIFTSCSHRIGMLELTLLTPITFTPLLQEVALYIWQHIDILSIANIKSRTTSDDNTHIISSSYIHIDYYYYIMKKSLGFGKSATSSSKAVASIGSGSHSTSYSIHLSV